jgi:hypothetical protein
MSKYIQYSHSIYQKVIQVKGGQIDETIYSMAQRYLR